MLTPCRRNARDNDGLNAAFNKCHSSARVVVENTIGVLKNSWRVLKRMHRQLNTKEDGQKFRYIIAATVVLQNMMARCNDVCADDNSADTDPVDSAAAAQENTTASAWREKMKLKVLRNNDLL